MTTTVAKYAESFFTSGKISANFMGKEEIASELLDSYFFETLTLTTRCGKSVKLEICDPDIVKELTLVSHPFNEIEEEFILKEIDVK